VKWGTIVRSRISGTPSISPDIFDEFPVVLVPVIPEQNQDEQLVLGADLLGKLTGMQIEMS
jgi:hypothetical protein